MFVALTIGFFDLKSKKLYDLSLTRQVNTSLRECKWMLLFKLQFSLHVAVSNIMSYSKFLRVGNRESRGCLWHSKSVK